MKPRKIAICAIACIMALMAAHDVAAAGLGDLFKAATGSNQDYAIFGIDLDLAQLKRTKGEIEAKVELDRMNAQSAYITAVSDYRRSVLGFYNEVLDAVFAAATASLDAESVGLSLENAREDRRYADSRYRNGLISEEVLKEIDIAFKSASTSQELAAWTFEDAKNTVRRVTGLEWKPELVPELPAFAAEAAVDEWLAADPALQKAKLAEKIAALRAASMATNASVYDRRIQETENLKAGVSVMNAETVARRAHASSLSTLKNQAALAQIRQDELALKERAAQDAQLQYEKGMLSTSDRNLRSIAVLTARKNLLASQRNYLKSIGAYLSALGKNPLGL
jgi:outer membrane protein TolC